MEKIICTSMSTTENGKGVEYREYGNIEKAHKIRVYSEDPMFVDGYKRFIYYFPDGTQMETYPSDEEINNRIREWTMMQNG